MSVLALALIMTSALAHATWNLLAKRVEGGAAFIWLFDGASTVMLAPAVVLIVVLHGLHLTPVALLLILASSTLHMGYFVLLNRGYRAGDLSLVYPLARGTGPLLATAGAVGVLGERPHPIVLAGALLIGAGAVALGANPRDLWRQRAGPAVGLALATGVLIAGYTLTDKEAVDLQHAPPLFYLWALTLLSTLWLTPAASRHGATVRQLWRQHRTEILTIGLLSPVAYFLVLEALVFTPVSYVAPAREVGILFGAIMGFHFLNEGEIPRRLSAAALMVAGVVLLAT